MFRDFNLIFFFFISYAAWIGHLKSVPGILERLCTWRCRAHLLRLLRAPHQCLQHVTHVTFDRYNGFLGLPQEFQVKVPGRVPSARVGKRNGSCGVVIGVFYFQAEGIFLINAENSHHEHVRDQLNKSIVPMEIGLHCLAGHIKEVYDRLCCYCSTLVT
ncbi:hypothetical protein M758_UG259100 [Ceratodon purpureus]|nr:hypothetical protein M758_UG259100 [Ceratodon purpureus]